MSYELWRTEDSKEVLYTAQAFVFDGWSHEPLVITRKQDAQAIQQHSDTVVVTSRPTASQVK